MVRYAATLDVRFLIVIGERRIKPWSRLPSGSNAAGKRFFAIGILDPVQAFRRVGVRHADLIDDIDVIDETRIVGPIQRSANCKSVSQAKVHSEAGFVTEARGLRILRSFCPHLNCRFAELRLARNIADRAAKRTRAIKCALRAKQNFDAFEVVQLEIHENRNFAQVGRDRSAAVVVAVTRTDCIDVQAAHDDRVTLTSAAIDDVDAGNEGQQLGKLGQPLLLDLLGTDCSDIERNVLHGFCTASGGHNDDIFIILPCPCFLGKQWRRIC